MPFSHRTGLEPIPPQLKLGEVSDELRRLLDYYISLEIDRESYAHPYSESRVFTDKWKRVAMDLQVLLFQQPSDKFNHGAYRNRQLVSGIIHAANIGRLFDLVEFLIRYPGCSDELKRELANAFVTARAAYRVFDNKYIAAMGTENTRG